jgi:SNF2 family DNA or RNA helicase
MGQTEAVRQASSQTEGKSLEQWKEEIGAALQAQVGHPLRLVLTALNEYPVDGDLLLAAALAALIEGRIEQSLRFQKRFRKHYLFEGPELWLLQALTWARQGRWGQAARLLDDRRLRALQYDYHRLRVLDSAIPWIREWIRRIDREQRALQAGSAPVRAANPVASRSHKAPVERQTSAGPNSTAPEPSPAVAELAPPLPKFPSHVPIAFSLPRIEGLLSSSQTDMEAPHWFRLRSEFARLSLLQGFDELLCLPQLHNVETYWYQVETVRMVLKQFRGRVLLADEVGLGKTIEAGMALKEYLLRGMADRVLILTPASMVGQWLEELAAKFDIRFASTYDSLLRNQPAVFWSQARVVASIATARRPEHLALLAGQHYDLVIVDEAHHLKNRGSQNWKLVNQLNKRFLLLLSATPVQNSLVELYNLLTLLKPGIFKTEKEFTSNYMTPGKPRMPANRERLRDLMREVMVRNSRSLVDVRLPRRRASTVRLSAGPEEAACYQQLSCLVREALAQGATPLRLTMRHLQAAAGSSPAAAASAIERLADTVPSRGQWDALRQRCRALGSGCKETALLELLKRNPLEKKIVFVHHRETLARLAQCLHAAGMEHVAFHGSLSGPEKDEAISRFRDSAPVLLSTESGGEGRNLQFCNTLINFDLPWNPMSIEQRIGRIHRIGQTRDVFVFNLVVQDTLEEYVLKILDEKINMFELVVGEVGTILGEMEDTRDFSEMVFAAWVESSEKERPVVFDTLGDQVAEARRKYEAVKTLDENLFGDDFATG